MNVHMIGATLAALLLVLPLLIRLYVERLPVAPTCPSCRGITRETGGRWPILQRIPALAITYVGECVSCGWRGRMRWRWALRSVHENEP